MVSVSKRGKLLDENEEHDIVLLHQAISSASTR